MLASARVFHHYARHEEVFMGQRAIAIAAIAPVRQGRLALAGALLLFPALLVLLLISP